MADLDQLSHDFLASIERAADLAALEAERVAALGKQGAITQLLKTLGGMTPEQRQAEGPRIHGLRERVTEAIASRKAALEAEALERRLATEGLDMTLPVAPPPQGSVHPVSQVMDELAEIFADMGFSVATGPEIEDDWHNFTALNFPPDHPARAMHDTFYLHRHPGRDPGEESLGGSPRGPGFRRDDDKKKGRPPSGDRPRPRYTTGGI
jgi:phenylalanyl-tRNA synthetase alpha chain